MYRRTLRSLFCLALLGAACSRLPDLAGLPVQPPSQKSDSPDLQATPDLRRLALIEKAVDWFIQSRPTESAQILESLTRQIEAHAGVVQTPIATVLPETAQLLRRLGNDERILVRVMDPKSLIVRDGFAGMRLGRTIYLPRDLEQRAVTDRLQAIVAHELGHDDFDVVRKQLHRRIDGITERELLWLDARLELRAHVEAMEKLARAGFEPGLISDYIRSMDTKQFGDPQMRYLATSADAALDDLRTAINMASRLR